MAKRVAASAKSAKSVPWLYHREEAGATWLSFAWGTGLEGEEQMPGAAYAEGRHAGAEGLEWTTFYPFDEHGCKWHTPGEEVDSTGRPHVSAPPRAMQAASYSSARGGESAYM